MLDCKIAMRLSVAILACVMAIVPPPLHGTTTGCSWRGPEPDWLLGRGVQVDERLTSLRQVIDFLHESGIPVSFISHPTEPDYEVRIEQSIEITVGDLLKHALADNPSYRLAVHDDKLIVYPVDQGYERVVDLGERHETSRVKALVFVLPTLRSRVAELRGLVLPTLMGPSGGFYRDSVPVGGKRSLIEHLASLIAGRPSGAFVILPKQESLMFSFVRPDVIHGLELMVPAEVEAGDIFDAIPRVKLEARESVTLFRPQCGVEYQSSDDSVVSIDEAGRAAALKPGRVRLVVTYEGELASQVVEVR